MDLENDVRSGSPASDGVHDEDVDDARQDRGPQLVPSSGGVERVLRPQNNCEVIEELTVEIGCDVHALPDRMS